MNLSKQPVDLRYLITKLIIFWFQFSELCRFEPYNNTSTEWSVGVEWSGVEYNLQCKRKCSVVSTSAPQVHKGFNVSLKPC